MANQFLVNGCWNSVFHVLTILVPFVCELNGTAGASVVWSGFFFVIVGFRISFVV